MKRVIFGVGIVVALITGLIGVTHANRMASAQSEPVMLTVYTLPDSDAVAGDRCVPGGSLDAWEAQPWQQVIVTDAADNIVGYLDIRDGAYLTIDDTLVCAVYNTLLIAESPFYTFTIGEAYRMTISSEALGEIDWNLRIQLP